MIDRPPVFAGAVKDTESWLSPTVAAPVPAAPGTVAGTVTFDSDEAALVPRVLVAVTEQEYDRPLVRPVTSTGLRGPATEVDNGTGAGDVHVAV